MEAIGFPTFGARERLSPGLLIRRAAGPLPLTPFPTACAPCQRLGPWTRPSIAGCGGWGLRAGPRDQGREADGGQRGQGGRHRAAPQSTGTIRLRTRSGARRHRILLASYQPITSCSVRLERRLLCQDGRYEPPAPRTRAATPRLRPAIETVIDCRVRTIALRQIPPGRTCPQHVEDAVNHPPVVHPRHAARLVRQQWLDQPPLYIRQIESRPKGSFRQP